MNSDDEALFAAVELEGGIIDELEADAGRPLGDDEGIGGAIDFEEGLLNATEGEDSQITDGSGKTLSDDILYGERMLLERGRQRPQGSTSAPQDQQQPTRHQRFQPDKIDQVSSNAGPYQVNCQALHNHSPILVLMATFIYRTP